MKISQFIKQFNWRFLLVRILMNAIALAITAIIVPEIYFVDRSVWNWLLMALMLGVLNALLKPVLQFLTLPFIFVTYGLVVVIVNALLLWLLSLIFPNRFAVENLLWALLGGLVLGLLSSFLESLLGLTMPIVPEEETALRRQLEDQARGIGSLMIDRRAAVLEEKARAAELQENETDAATHSAAVPAVAVLAAADVPASGAEEESPVPDDDVRLSVPAVSPQPQPGPELAASSVEEPAEEQEEDRS
jgi:putative membrane protein